MPIDPDLLLAGFFNGTLDAEQTAELEQWLLADSAHADAFARYACDQRALEHSLRMDRVSDLAGLTVSDFELPEPEHNDSEGSSTILAALLALDARSEAAMPVDLTAELEQRRRRKLERERQRLQLAQSHDASGPTKRVIVIPKAAVWLGLAAAVGLVIWLGLVATSSNKPTAPTAGHEHNQDTMPTQTPTIATSVALIRSSVDAQWADRDADGNAYLARGAVVSLTHGYAEVVFGDGAAVIVAAPATFEPTGPNGMRLIAGSITATCPESAHLFEVATAAGRIVDLGTEFGVAIDENGATRAQVFSGKVTLTPSSAAGERGWAEEDTVNLTAGVAALATAEGRVLSATPDELAYVRAEEFEARRDADESAYARWLAHSYRLRRDADVMALYVFDREDEASGTLANRSPTGRALDGHLGNGEEIVAPHWTPGRFDQTRALRFGHAGQGRTYGVVVPDGEALDLDSEMTFALWVRPINTAAFYGTLLSKREVPPRRMNYQVSVMHEWHQGGQELQFGTGVDDASVRGFGYSPASGRLGAGGWIHLVFTTDGRAVRYYINGEEVFSHRQALSPLTNNADLLIGTNAVGGGAVFFNDAIPFLGDISELLIARRAFDGSEIHELYLNSRGAD